ncbi:MAG: hypothetical protein HKO90_03825 [Flavobacteriaceae bacterium]|nr:hypothetical protein [Flavobacteriaceae bacterium]
MEGHLKTLREFLLSAYRNGGNLFIIKLIGLALNYGVLLLILYYYGFEGNGEYAVKLELARGLKVFVVFGLDYLIVKEVTALIEDYTENTGQLLAVFLFSNVFFISIFLLLSLFFEIDNNILYWTLFMAFWRFISHFFRGRDNMLAYGFFEFAVFQGIVFSSIILANFVFNTMPFESLINILNLIGLVLCFIVVLPKMAKTQNLRGFLSLMKKGWNNILRYYKRGLNFVLTNSSNILSVSILYIIIKDNYSSEVLGIYDTVLKFAMIISLPLIAVSGRVMTLAAKYFNHKKIRELRNYIGKVTKMLILGSSILTIGVCVFFWIYSSYFNLELKDYWPLFLILLAAQLVNNWTGPVGVVLQVSNNEKIFNRITIISAIYLIISTFIFAKFFDIYIIAVNMIVYLLMINLMSLYVQKKKLGIQPHADLFRKIHESDHPKIQ